MLKIPKKSLEVLFTLTKGTEEELNLSESRTRDAFIKDLAPVLDSFYQDRTKIYQTFCIKLEDGSPDFKVVENDNGKILSKTYQFPLEKEQEISQELTTLYGETVELNVPSNLKEILEKSTYKPKIGETTLIDEIFHA